MPEVESKRKRKLSVKERRRHTDKFIEDIPTPEGFTKKVEEGGIYSGLLCILESADIKIEFSFHLDPSDWDGKYPVSLDGSVSFDANGGRRTFDRAGIESSFSGLGEETGAQIVEEQIARVRKSQARFENAVRIPGYKYTLTPEEKEKAIETLKKKGSRSFYPGGMGIAHTFQTNRVPYSERAPKETEEFFGISPLYVSRIDYD